MNVFILTEVGDNIGFGHLSRCISICQSFQQRNIIPKIILNTKGNYDLNLNQKYIDFDWINDNDRLFKIINNSDVVIIDSYLAPISLYQKISSSVKIKAYIDDYQRLDYPEGIIINPSIFAEKLNYPKKGNTAYLLGCKYAPLRREFWKVLSRTIKNKIEQILIMSGGEDLRNLTPKIQKYLAKKYPDLKKKIVIGYGFKHIESINKQKDEKTELIYYPDAKYLKNLMLEADLAISAAGQTLYELACIGVPTIAVSVADNQINNAINWQETGFIKYAGYWDDKRLLNNINVCLNEYKDYNIRKRSYNVGRKYIQGDGSRLVARFIINKLNYHDN